MLFGGLNLAELGQHAEQLKALVTGVLNSIQQNEAALIELKNSNVQLTDTLASLTTSHAALIEQMKRIADAAAPGRVEVPIVHDHSMSQAPDDAVRLEGRGE